MGGAAGLRTLLKIIVKPLFDPLTSVLFPLVTTGVIVTSGIGLGAA